MRYSNIFKESGSVPSSEGLPIDYDFYVPSGNSGKRFPVILFLHGFKGFKDWGAFPDACAEISAAGFAVLAMNFSLNGMGENMFEFDQLDLFARETLSQDLDDVGTVISALQNGTISTDKAGLHTDTIGILGHSRGGHTAVAAAAEYSEIVCLVTWSAVADYNARWSNEMISDWNEKGVTEIKNSRTGQMMPVKDVVYKDALTNADRLMAIKRVQELNLPVLFIHSKGDESVPFRDAEKLYRNCPSEDKELKLIPGSGHTFDIAHPFEEEEFPEAFQQVLDSTVEWFEYYLQ
jgi:dienelactone hydrolase